MEKIYKNWWADGKNVYIYYKDDTVEIAPMGDLSYDEVVDERCKLHQQTIRNKKIDKIINGK